MIPIAVRFTDHEISLLPTPVEVAEYRRTGYYLTRKIFTDDEIDAVVEASDRLYARQFDDLGVDLPEGYRPQGEYGDRLRKNDYSSLISRVINAFVRKPILGAIGATLAGAGEVRLWHDQLLYKPVDTGVNGATRAVGWHTDRGYWKSCSSDEMLTAWIPFHDCDERLGTITMIEGSNNWGEDVGKLDFFADNLDEQEREMSAGGRAVVKVPMNIPKGHCSFHHCHTIHGSLANRGDRPRRSLAVHMQDGPNHYREFMLPGGHLAVHGNEALVRRVDGVPDFSDPRVCPVLYPQL